jgi:hypothetical protein
MKIKTLKSIVKAIKEGRSNVLPMLDCFYIDKEFLYFSNLEIFIRLRHHFPVTPDSQPLVVRADHFIQRIDHIRAPYFINCDTDGEITFEMPESESTMKSEPAEDYPLHHILPDKSAEAEPPKPLFDLSAYEVQLMDIATAFVADDELRPVMSTICISKDFIVASDAHKLYFRKITELYTEDVMFDKKVIKLMMLFPGYTYKISQSKKNCCAESKDVTIWWRLIKDGGMYPNTSYPNWRKVIPESTHSVKIPVKETIEALNAVSFALNQSSHCVRCKITGNKIRLSGKDLDFGISSSESVNIINPMGNDIEFGIKFEFFKLILKCLMDEGYPQVTMGYVDATSAFVFADQFLCMPMMLTEV